MMDGGPTTLLDFPANSQAAADFILASVQHKSIKISAKMVPSLSPKYGFNLNSKDDH